MANRMYFREKIRGNPSLPDRFDRLWSIGWPGDCAMHGACLVSARA